MVQIQYYLGVTMDLTDEQWSIIQPLIPDPPRRPDGKGRPWKDARDVMNAVLWILRVQVLLGMTCLTGIHHTRHVIEGFSNGFIPGYLKRFFIHWQQIYVNEEGLICLNALSTVLS